MTLADRINLEFDTPPNLPNLGIYKVGLHLLQILFAFITLFLTSSIISIERHYLGGSKAAPNYTLVMAVTSILVAAALAYFPWSKVDKGFVKIRSFFLRPRTTVIFTCFMTLSWFVAMISMTVHSTNQTNCSLDQTILKNDTSYAGAWVEQCNCARATAAFSWFSFFVWLGTAVFSAILLWHEKKLRHAENILPRNSNKDNEDNQTTVSNSDTSYDEDARTITDIHYSEKDKLPITNNKNTGNDGSHHNDRPGAISSTPSFSTPSLPVPSAPPMANSDNELAASYVPGVKQPYDETSVIIAPSGTSNTASPYVPEVTVASPSPYPTPLYALDSPYTNSNGSPYLNNHSASPFIPSNASSYSQQQQYRGPPQFTDPYPNTLTSAQHQYGLTDTMYQNASTTPVAQPYQHQPISYSQQYPQ